jgi:hypothetical protein
MKWSLFWLCKYDLFLRSLSRRSLFYEDYEENNQEAENEEMANASCVCEIEASVKCLSAFSNESWRSWENVREERKKKWLHQSLWLIWRENSMKKYLSVYDSRRRLEKKPESINARKCWRSSQCVSKLIYDVIHPIFSWRRRKWERKHIIW